MQRNVRHVTYDIQTIKDKLEKLYREKSKLDSQPYSQSDPGAVLDRRWVRRDIESNEAKLEVLQEELKQCMK
jgi:hypothetical protein